ncbi:MAG: SpoIIE family protein phosphatase [Bacteroidia bacterium]|nr:SpoIIE family protein phosphatase [Bacteroidia bacterium]
MKTIFKILFLLLSLRAYSQKAFETKPKVEFDYFTKFDTYTAKHGLSNNYVKAITQDNIGFMWFGTNDGLNRFDGYEFKVYKNIPNDENSLSDNVITCLAVDIYDNLWVGTINGLNKFNKNTNTFSRYMYSDSIENTIANNWVRALYADREGFLFIETTDGTFHKYDIKKNHYKYFKHSGGISEIYPMHQIYEDNNGIIWIGGSNTRGLIKFDKKKEIITEHIYEKIGGFSSFLEDKSGNFYLGNHWGTIHLLNKTNFQLKEIPLVSIYSIIEDNTGNIWFGGYGSGAIKYEVENNKMTIYKHLSENCFSILDNQILKIYQDKSGVIWFGTKQGISKLSYYKYKFKHFFHIANLDKSISSNRISCAVEDNDSIIWFGTIDNGLDKFNRNSGIFTNYKYNITDITSIGSNRITGLALDKKSDYLWISLWNGYFRVGGALNRMDKKKEVFSRYNIAGDHWLSGVICDKNNNIWTLSWCGGPILFDKEKGQPTLVHFWKNTIPFGNINKLIIDKNNILWWGGGFYDIDSNQFYNFAINYKSDDENLNRYYEYYLNKCKSVPNNIIVDNPPYHISNLISINDDEKDNKWYCYDNGTIAKFFSDKKHFEFFSLGENIKCACLQKYYNNLWIGTNTSLKIFNTQTKEAKNELKLENINTLFEDNKNMIWIGTDSAIYLYNIATKKLNIVQKNITCNLIFPYDNENIWIAGKNTLFEGNINTYEINPMREVVFKNIKSEISIYCIYPDTSSNIWLGTNIGLFFYNTKGKKVTEYKHDDKNQFSIISNTVFTIDADEQNNIWLGTDKGLSRFDIKKQIFINYNYVSQNSLTHACTICAFEDEKGYFWLGSSHEGGLSKVDVKKQTIEQFYFQSYDSTGLSHKNATCIFQDSKGIIWVGTENGLNKLNENLKNFTHYTTKNGFPDNSICGILEDDHYNLWISTNKGLAKFNPLNESLTVYTYMDGLQDDEFSNACCKLYTGEMLFAGYNGFNIFHPDSIFLNKYKPTVYLTKIQINDFVINNIYCLEKLSLPYSQNNLLFEFSAFEYNFPEQCKYKYKLDGFDKDWINSDASMRVAKYTNIPEGNYTFRVKAANNDNLWSDDEYVLSITIAPPWWRTWLFRISVLVFGVSAIILYIKWRERKLKKEKEILEKIVNERTQQLREANEELNQQNEEITAQRDMILGQNEELQQQKEEIEVQRDEIACHRDTVVNQKKEIEASIRYAKRIQTAVLPTEKYADSILGEHFIIFHPKDVVSGDFYWATQVNKWLIVTVTDCTGHGVPGAFMSMLAVSFLNEIIRKKEVTNAAMVLNYLRTYIIEALQQTGEEGTQKDGMDMSLAAINIETKQCQWAGANNPLWIIRNPDPQGQIVSDGVTGSHGVISGTMPASHPGTNTESGLASQVIEIIPDKMPVAVHLKMDNFTNHEIKLSTGDKLYLFSDGYHDQFGGPNSKKFKYSAFKKLIAETSGLSMKEQGEKIELALENWMNYNGQKYEQIDDITVVGLKI